MATSEKNRSPWWGSVGAAALVLAVLGWAAAAGGASAAGARGDRIGVEVAFSRATDAEGRYRCTTTVTDLVSGTVLARPELVLPERENGTVTIDGEEAGWELVVTAFVSEGGKRLDHAVVLRRDGEISTSQSLTFHFDG